jgi:peroxiredoxin
MGRLRLVMFFMVLASACSGRPPSPTIAPTPAIPEWFAIELADVVTGETFSISDYAGRVVLLETMAMWCPTCLFQALDVKRMHESLENPKDVISVSLDVDVNEDAAALKEYVEQYGLTGHFAIAPLEVARALGNLYTAQYLNPPLAPMMIIDRDGQVHHLQYGRKRPEVLLEQLTPFLSP